jgi:hypothetical protein
VWGNTHDFTLDADGRVYWHSTNGTLARRLSNGTWETLDQNVTKFVVSNSGNAYSLATDGWLALNGSDRWANTKDFAVGADEAVYWLNTSNNLYFRPNGGSWTSIDQNVTKFAVSQDGAAYALRADGWLTVRGKNTWDRTHDFILTDNQTLYWHNLGKSLYKKPSGGSWQLLGQVLQFAIRQDGLEHLLTSDGSVRVGGVVQYTGVSQMALDEFGQLVLEGFDNSSQLVAGQFMLSRRFA